MKTTRVAADCHSTSTGLSARRAPRLAAADAGKSAAVGALALALARLSLVCAVCDLLRGALAPPRSPAVTMVAPSVPHFASGGLVEIPVPTAHPPSRGGGPTTDTASTASLLRCPPLADCTPVATRRLAGLERTTLLALTASTTCDAASLQTAELVTRR